MDPIILLVYIAPHTSDRDCLVHGGKPKTVLFVCLFVFVVFAKLSSLGVYSQSLSEKFAHSF